MDQMEDFGFTFGGEPEVDDRAERIFFIVDNFLNNLKKNPEASTIKWPNRAEEVEKFQAKIKAILENRKE